MDKVRVLRIIEYIGPRDEIEMQILRSLHGTKHFKNMEIRVATIGTYPEILETEVDNGGVPPQSQGA